MYIIDTSNSNNTNTRIDTNDDINHNTTTTTTTATTDNTNNEYKALKTLHEERASPKKGGRPHCTNNTIMLLCYEIYYSVVVHEHTCYYTISPVVAPWIYHNIIWYNMP